MTLREFMANPEWDTPFFKRLAHNDTRQAAGHQAGMVLPKDLRQFLPSLDVAVTSSITPTTDRDLRAEMFSGLSHVVDSTVRYQFQTWGGTRPPESRITNGFQPLYDRASEGDVLIFQRRADSIDRFRLILVKQGTAEFREINAFVGSRRWGALYSADTPVTQQIMADAAEDLLSLAQKPFEVLRQDIPRIETRQMRIARSSVFRESVRREYGRICAVSRISIATPTYVHEVESAHIVPISERGTDDVRNGLALCQTLHWAFDRGLFGVLPDRTVYVPRKVQGMSENSFLKQFIGKPVKEANTKNLQVHGDAFRWHMDNRVRQWD